MNTKVSIYDIGRCVFIWLGIITFQSFLRLAGCSEVDILNFTFLAYLVFALKDIDYMAIINDMTETFANALRKS